VLSAWKSGAVSPSFRDMSFSFSGTCLQSSRSG
jgi:hypothetical protein